LEEDEIIPDEDVPPTVGKELTLTQIITELYTLD
jgi:hypothetical protein